VVTRQDSSDILLNHSRDVLTAAAADVRDAVSEFGGARAWLANQTGVAMVPFGVEVWAFNEALASVPLIRHRWRGWVPPGGKVDPGEALRAAATRELFEETGQLTACSRRYHDRRIS
jgi:8-oxo-dGTP diphosphatase